MSNHVKLSDAVFYNVNEIIIEHDAENANCVHMKLIYHEPDKLPRAIPFLSASRITLFAPGDDGDERPRVYVDGKFMEPNPQPVEETVEEKESI